MSLPNYLTLAHLRKVIAALGQRFTRIENDLERVDTIIENGIQCASMEEVEEVCEALDMVAVVVESDEWIAAEA